MATSPEPPAAAPRDRSRQQLRRELVNLPNCLTYLRILMVPAVVLLIDNTSRVRSFIAAIIYITACVTDLFDGYLARKWGQVSLVGKLLDPLADKLIVMAALVYLVDRGRCPAWLAAVVLARELAITGLRGIASSEGLVIAAGREGKMKTGFQMVGIIFLLAHFRYPLLGLPYTFDCHVIGIWTLYLSLGLSLFSFGQYVQLFVQSTYRHGR